MTRPNVVGFGEAMLRLSVPKGERLASVRQFEAHVGGTEANVLAALAQLGWDAIWLSALPAHELGDHVSRTLQSYGVDIKHVFRVPDARLGTYFFEAGVMPRPGRVVYDRADSAFARLAKSQFGSSGDDGFESWVDVVTRSRLLVVTGVTAALTQSTTELLDELVAAARSHKVDVSFDVNYRSALWPPEVARPVLLGLIDRAQVVFCSLRDGNVLFEDSDFTDETIAVEKRAEKLACAIRDRGATTVVISMTSMGIFVADRSGSFIEPAPRIEEVVDRVGAGDAMAAGVLHGYLAGDIRLGARLGSYLSGLALGQFGDLTVLSAADVALGESGAGSTARIER